MSKPIVVIWQNGVNLFQDNTETCGESSGERSCFTISDCLSARWKAVKA